MPRRPPLESLTLTVSEAAAPLFEAALRPFALSVSLIAAAPGRWRIEAIGEAAARAGERWAALALAEGLSGETPERLMAPVPAGGWLERSRAGFPEVLIGRRFVVRPTHLPPRHRAGRITLSLDAGLAFGSGEHGSTRGCLRALERLASRRPGRILDLGTGSGILAMAAARLWRRRVLGTDIEPWSIRVAAENARRNGLGPRVRLRLADGWRGLRRAARFDLVLANLLARPLCRMARDLAQGLAPGGVAVLSGLLANQERMVLAAHRRHGLVLAGRLTEGPWRTLILRAGGQPIFEGRSLRAEAPSRGTRAGTARR